MVRDLVPADISNGYFAEAPSTFRCSTGVNDKGDKTELRKGFGMGPPLGKPRSFPLPVDEGPLYCRTIWAGIDEVNDRVLAPGVEIIRLVQDSVEVGLAVGSLEDKLFWRLAVKLLKSADVRFREDLKQFPVGAAQLDDRGSGDTRVRVKKKLLRRRKGGGVVPGGVSEALVLSTVEADAIQVRVVRSGAIIMPRKVDPPALG